MNTITSKVSFRDKRFNEKFKVSHMVQKRKYNRGNLPCGPCGDGKHKKCRPRFEGVLCSCSCPRAEKVRDDVDLEVTFRRRNNLPINLPEILKMFSDYEHFKTPYYAQCAHDPVEHHLDKTQDSDTSVEELENSTGDKEFVNDWDDED